MRKTPSAFTIVELMVVISIIALLMALLLPALQSARGNARVMVCQNNLRNISMGLSIYIQDSKGCYPHVDISWMQSLSEYVGKPGSPVYVCPEATAVGGTAADPHPTSISALGPKGYYAGAKTSYGILTGAAGEYASGSWASPTSMILKLNPGVGPTLYKLDSAGNPTAQGYNGTTNINRRRPYELNPYIVESYGWRIGNTVAHPVAKSRTRVAYFRHREARMNYISIGLGVLSIPFARMDQATFDYHRTSADGSDYWGRIVGDKSVNTPYGIRTTVNNWPYDLVQQRTPSLVGAY